MERGVELWHMICVTDVFSGLWPQMQKMGDPDSIMSMSGWLELHKPVDLETYVAALTEREALLLRWMAFFQQWPLMILPTLADLPPRQVADIQPGGQKDILHLDAHALSPRRGLPGLAVPVRACTARRAPVCAADRWQCAIARISASTPARSSRRPKAW